MLVTKTFQNGNSQAVRIPAEIRSERSEFYIQKIGEVYIMYPTDDPWFPLRQTMGTFPQDFMVDREQPSWADVYEREAF